MARSHTSFNWIFLNVIASLPAFNGWKHTYGTLLVQLIGIDLSHPFDDKSMKAWRDKERERERERQHLSCAFFRDQLLVNDQ